MGGRRKHQHGPAPLEKAIQAAVIHHWRMLGVDGSLVAAIPNMRAFGQAGLTPGLPDLMVITPTLGNVTGFIELKRDHGNLSQAQLDVLAIMHENGIPYAVCVGRDEPILQLARWGALRPQRAEAA